MQALDYESLRGFNRDLRAAIQLGIALDIEGRSDSRDAQLRWLDQIEQRAERFSANLSHGLAETLRSEPDIPSSYLEAWRAWQQSAGAPMALEPLAAPAAALACELRRSRVAGVVPAIWLILGFLIFLFLSKVIFPGFAALAESLRYESAVLQALQVVDRYWLFFAILIPTLSLVGWLYVRHGAKTRRTQLQSNYVASRTMSAEANRAAELATVGDLPTGFPVEDAAGSPLLEWAKLGPADALAGRYRFVSRLYDSIGRLHSRRLHDLSPTKQSVVLGGVLALLLALLVFAPLIDLLVFVASERPVQ